MNLCSKIESIDFHYSIAKRQRDAYNLMKNDLEEDYLLIEMDWKQKILIGMIFKLIYFYRKFMFIITCNTNVFLGIITCNNNRIVFRLILITCNHLMIFWV